MFVPKMIWHGISLKFDLMTDFENNLSREYKISYTFRKCDELLKLEMLIEHLMN